VPVAVLLCITACAKADRASTSDTNQSAGTTAQPLAAQAKQLPGELTKPISEYTGAELRALVKDLKFVGGQERERRCKGSTGCAGTNPATRTRVRVDAVDGVDSLGTTNVPRYGVIALRALVRGAAMEAMYNMRAGGRHEYYLIVLPNPNGGTPTWQLEQLERADSTLTHTAVATGVFQPCNHPFVRGARADFKSCEPSAKPASIGAVALQGGFQDPLWVSCAFGCCVGNAGGGG
jgi:hypothetical protein